MGTESDIAREVLEDAEREELEALRLREAVRSAGFDPASPTGRALADLADYHKTPATSTALRRLAQTYGLTPGESEPARGADPAPAVAPATGPDDIDSRIADAEADGRWGEALALKAERLARARQASEPKVDPASAAEIAEAEAEGRWLDAGRIKLGTLSTPAADADPDLDAQIAAAEAAGDWFKSGRLKLEKLRGEGAR